VLKKNAKKSKKDKSIFGGCRIRTRDSPLGMPCSTPTEAQEQNEDKGDHEHPHRRAGFEPMAPGIGGGQSYTLLIPKSLEQIQYWGGAELKGMTLRAVWWFASCNAGIYTPHPHAQMATKKMIPSLPETSHFRNVVFQKHHVLKT